MLIALTAGCGTRVEGSGHGSAQRQPVGGAMSAMDGESGTGGAPAPHDPTGATTPVAGQGSPGQHPGRNQATATATRPASQASAGFRAGTGDNGTVAPASGGGVGTAPGAAGAPGRTTTPSGPQPGTVPAPGVPSTPAASSGRSPITIGTIGTLSGPAGSIFLGIAQGVQVWAKDVNTRGGVNSHPVRVNVYDDAGDPSRHRAQLQQAIEKDGVAAFVANPEAITGNCCVEYIESKRIPMIGSETGSPWFNESPMYFPQASSGDDALFGAIAGVAQQMVPQGKTKLGAITCVEAQVCKDAQRVWAAAAERLDLQVVYQTQVSLGQPDFTAECLAARNAGAEIVLMGFDSNSVRRVVSSCARQSYRPTFATLSAAIAESYKEDANFEGMVATTQGFPWFQTGTPATDEYQAAMERYGSNVAPSASPALGWLAGKVFERAAVKLPEPPTSADILDGLWRIQNDSIGGLTSPLTFRQDQASPQKACWFNVLLKNRAWRSPDGFKLNCSR